MAIATFTPLSPASLSTAESDVGMALVTIVFTPSSLANAKSLLAAIPIGGDAIYPVSDHLQPQFRQPGFDRGDLLRRKMIIQILVDLRADLLSAIAFNARES